jgi:hypothetical protein
MKKKKFNLQLVFIISNKISQNLPINQFIVITYYMNFENQKRERKVWKDYRKSRIYKIGIPLVPIIVASSIGAIRVRENFINNKLKFFIRWILMESSWHGLLIKFLEALHGTVGHHQHSIHDLFFVLSDEFETQVEQHAVMGKDIWVFTLHQLYIVFC